ncbi:uncharacterized protein LOC117100042 [Anneissia japonica]|uniref:uncharacterized protein LOC117100042 n=1 Tax=Anneissia japonica TaxID=1529436 RepID=UPI0014258146|nr:uncharacterized protein LOC117100042 [Anneissia japonica]
MMIHQAAADHTSELHLWNGLFSYHWYAFSGFVVVIVIGIAIGLIRGCRPHENPELLLIKSSLMSLDCIHVGTKTFRKRRSERNYNHEDVHNHDDYYEDNDDKQREFYELELYHRSPYHRSTNERSRWLTEGNQFYESKSKHTSDQVEVDACEDISEQRCRLIGQSSSRASSTDSAYATVRGFDFRRIQDVQKYEEEPFNGSIQNSVECIEEMPSKPQTVGRFSVAVVHVEKEFDKKTPENEDVNESPSLQRAGSTVDFEEPSNTLKKVTLSTNTVCSSNNMNDNDQNVIEKSLSNIDNYENVNFKGQTKKAFKIDRFLVSKCNSSERLFQAADPHKIPSDIAAEVCGDCYRYDTINLPSGENSTTNMEDSLVDSSKQRHQLLVKGKELSNASNPMQLSTENCPNRMMLLTASDIGEFDNLLQTNDADILNRDLNYLETEL